MVTSARSSEYPLTELTPRPLHESPARKEKNYKTIEKTGG